MTGKRFLPALFVFQLLELLAGVYFLANGHYLLAVGTLAVLLAITVPVARAQMPDPKTEENGEILEILQSFARIQAGILRGIKCGSLTWDDYHTMIEKEAAFRNRIEIDPYDRRCLYRWKKTST